VLRNFGLMLTALVLAPVMAIAQQSHDNWPNWYLGLSGQMAFVPDADVDGGGVNGEVSFDEGYAVSGALGFRPYRSNSVFDNTRFELEYSYRGQDFDNFSGTVGGIPTNIQANGDLSGSSIMLNAFYDFRNDSGFTPYLGAGAGATFWNFDSSALGVDDQDTVFGYQGMAGIYYSPETLPNTDWGVGYRYFATLDPEFSNNLGGTIEHDYDSHNVELLARFRF
jgi:opacity protein-like surface antigen